VERAAPLLNLRIEGDLEATITLVPDRPRAADALLPALEGYSENARDRLTVYKPTSRENAVWIHPGEPVFDSLSASILGRFGRDGLKGAVFVDPYAPEAYLFHLALVSVEQDSQINTGPTDLWGGCGDGETAPKLLESRLVGLRQSSDGAVEECPPRIPKRSSTTIPGSKPSQSRSPPPMRKASAPRCRTFRGLILHGAPGYRLAGLRSPIRAFAGQTACHRSEGPGR
jgi:hypothetical protein